DSISILESIVTRLPPRNGVGYCSLQYKGRVRSGIQTHASIRRPEIPLLRKVHRLESIVTRLPPRNGVGYCSLKSKGHVRSASRAHASIRRPEIPQLRKVHHLESGALDCSAILTSTEGNKQLQPCWSKALGFI